MMMMMMILPIYFWIKKLGRSCCLTFRWKKTQNASSAFRKVHRQRIQDAIKGCSRARYNLVVTWLSWAGGLIADSPGWWQLKYFWNLNPNFGGNDPIWRAYFWNGLVHPPTREWWFIIFSWEAWVWRCLGWIVERNFWFQFTGSVGESTCVSSWLLFPQNYGWTFRPGGTS